jgi:acyl-CoA synthetase (AMP-forming)/AMP-acid ligase II
MEKTASGATMLTRTSMAPSSRLAMRSPDGYYTLQGRRSDLTISGGFSVYLPEIEELFIGFPASWPITLGESVVFGV